MEDIFKKKPANPNRNFKGQKEITSRSRRDISQMGSGTVEAIIWLSLLTIIAGCFYEIHRTYETRNRKTIKQFESKWNKLHKKYK